MYLTHALFAICNLLWYCTQYFKTFNTLKSCLFHNEISGRKYLITISSMICSVMRSLDVNSDFWFHIHLITNIAVIQ